MATSKSEDLQEGDRVTYEEKNNYICFDGIFACWLWKYAK